MVKSRQKMWNYSPAIKLAENNGHCIPDTSSGFRHETQDNGSSGTVLLSETGVSTLTVWTILPVNARTGPQKTFPELQNSLLSDSLASSLFEVGQRRVELSVKIKKCLPFSLCQLVLRAPAERGRLSVIECKEGFDIMLSVDNMICEPPNSRSIATFSGGSSSDRLTFSWISQYMCSCLVSRDG